MVSTSLLWTKPTGKDGPWLVLGLEETPLKVSRYYTYYYWASTHKKIFERTKGVNALHKYAMWYHNRVSLPQRTSSLTISSTGFQKSSSIIVVNINFNSTTFPLKMYYIFFSQGKHYGKMRYPLKIARWARNINLAFMSHLILVIIGLNVCISWAVSILSSQVCCSDWGPWAKRWLEG